jgi:hypothetical protein
MKIILSSLLSFLLVFLILEANQLLKAEEREIGLKLNPPEEVLKSSSEVKLYVSVKNLTDHEVGIIRSPGKIPEEQIRYNVDIRDSDGKRPAETSYFKDLNSPSTFVQTSNIGYYLKPGESVTDVIILTKLYVLKVPGKYKVWVSRSFPKSQMGVVKSNEITITIVN